MVNKASKKARQESSTSGKLTFFACKIRNLIQKLALNPFSKDRKKQEVWIVCIGMKGGRVLVGERGVGSFLLLL